MSNPMSSLIIRARCGNTIANDKYEEAKRMTKDHIEEFKDDLQEFEEMTKKFYKKEISVPEYKHFSGGFGSYAQRGGGSSMLRLRLTGGEITRDTLGFIAESIEKYKINLAHLTTCQSLQFHNLNEAQVCALIREAQEHGIITRGGGGDYPRNVMASPLSGVLPGEAFDVLPYAKEATDYLLGLIKTVRLPRKLKVCFSNTEEDEVHAAFRDLGFIARKDGTFDVYCAGGLGRNPRMGIKAASGVEPNQILYHIRAMIDVFTACGNYENRGRARTRYLQEDLGPDGLLSAYRKKLKAALCDKALALALAAPDTSEPDRTADIPSQPRLIPQKQPGLYAVLYKPAGGNVPVERFRQLYNALSKIRQASVRIAPTQCMYVIGCTAPEAEQILALTPDSARTRFALSMSCIGAGICQVGARNSQATLDACMKAIKPLNLPDRALPMIRISGCPSSCSAHQIAALGFRGGVCQSPDGPKPAYAVYAGGCDRLGEARFAEELGVMPENQIPDFLAELGTVIAEAGSTYEQWTAENREEFLKIVQKYLHK